MDYFKVSRFFLYAIPFALIIVTPSTLFPFIVGKYVWFRAVSALALIFFLLGLAFDKQARVYVERLKQAVRSPLFIAMSAFTAAFLVACLAGISPQWSFWSNFERGEGGLQILHLYVFFTLLLALLRDEKEWKPMSGAFTAAAVGMILYGVGAALHIGNFIGPGGFGERFQGSLGNSAYVAAYLFFAAFFATITVRKHRPLLIALLLLFGLFFILTQTRGALIGLGVGAVVALGYVAVRNEKWRKVALGALVAFLICGGTLFALKNTAMVKNSPFARLLDITISTQTFGTRLGAWRIAWKGFLERPLFGWGPGNYLYLFQHVYDPVFYNVETGEYGAWFDEAHSLIFNHLAETGAVGTLAFFSVLVAAFARVWGKRKDVGEKVRHIPLRALVIGSFTAYIVQGLVLFNVLSIYIPLMALLAWSEYRFNPRLFEPKNV